MNRLSTIAIAALLLGAGAAFAQATLSEEKAIAGSVTPGDAPGWPITLSASGHYKLMGNLNVPKGGTAIEVTAPDVTLDLNGFRIVSTGLCTYNIVNGAVACTNHVPYAYGVIARNKVANLTVRNGTIRGFMTGIDIEDGQVSDVHMSYNRWGLSAGSPGSVQVTRSVFDTNETGASTGCATLIENSTVTRNYKGVFGCGNLINSIVVANVYGLWGMGMGYHSVRLRNKTDLVESPVKF